jgi:NAD(P)-dependent dehydrogenase (short-subunit alcohol dehydrogenase family)
MAKAALNMMTRTAATDYHGDGIHMNSVDTGWVTDEDPLHVAEQKTAEHRFRPPLDIVDGRRASSTRSSTARTPASTSGASSSRTTSRPTGSRRADDRSSQYADISATDAIDGPRRRRIGWSSTEHGVSTAAGDASQLRRESRPTGRPLRR